MPNVVDTHYTTNKYSCFDDTYTYRIGFAKKKKKRERKKACNIKLDTNLMQERFYMLRNVSMLQATESTEVYQFSFYASSSSTADKQA